MSSLEGIDVRGWVISTVSTFFFVFVDKTIRAI